MSNVQKGKRKESPKPHKSASEVKQKQTSSELLLNKRDVTTEQKLHELEKSQKEDLVSGRIFGPSKGTVVDQREIEQSQKGAKLAESDLGASWVDLTQSGQLQSSNLGGLISSRIQPGMSASEIAADFVDLVNSQISLNGNLSASDMVREFEGAMVSRNMTHSQRKEIMDEFVKLEKSEDLAASVIIGEFEKLARSDDLAASKTASQMLESSLGASWTKLEEAKPEVEGKKEKPLRKTENLLDNPKTQKEFNEARKYVEDALTHIEGVVYKEEYPKFQKAWDDLYREVHGEILKGKSYDEIAKKYGEKWVSLFQVPGEKFNKNEEKEIVELFKEAFGYAGKGLSKEGIAELKAYQKTAAFAMEVVRLRDRIFYSKARVFIAKKLEERKNKEPKEEALIKALGLLDKVSQDEKNRAYNLMRTAPKRLDMSSKLKEKYETILEEAKVHDYSSQEIWVAREVVSTALTAMKAHCNGGFDAEAWKILVSREPMLQKAVLLLFQKNYNDLNAEFRKKELLAQNEAGQLTPAELTRFQEEMGTLELIKERASVFFRGLLPWNQVAGAGRLREDASAVRTSIINIHQIGEVLAMLVKPVAGDSFAEALTEYANKLDTAVLGLEKEVEEAYKGERLQYVVRDFTIEPPDTGIVKGIKSLMKWIVSKPSRLEEDKGVFAWLADYGKAAALGSVAGAGIAAFQGRSVTAGAVGGAVAGISIEYFKPYIKSFIGSAIPGAVVGIGIVIGMAAVGALSATGGIFIVGIAAVLFGLFGVWVLHRTKIGEEIRTKIENFVYSDEVAYFEQWNERVNRAKLAREAFEKTAELAEKRQGRMHLRTELMRDSRYQSLEDICKRKGMGLTLEVRDKFLEQIRLNPQILGEPQKMREVLKEIKDDKGVKVNEDIVEQMIAAYCQDNEGALKVGLEKRYENLEQALMKLDPRMKGIIEKLKKEGENEKEILKYDNRLKALLEKQGVSKAVIDKVFGEANKVLEWKDSIMDANVFRRGAHAFWSAIGKLWSREEAVDLEKVKAELGPQFDEDARLVQALLVLREVAKNKQNLADEGELRALLKSIGFDDDTVNKMLDIELVDTKARALEKFEEGKSKIVSFLGTRNERGKLEKGAEIENVLLMDYFIQQGQEMGFIPSDDELLSDEEIEAIKRKIPENPKREFEDDDIPEKPITDDRVLLLRFNMRQLKIGKNRRIEGPSEEVEKFKARKQEYLQNFGKIQSAMKRKKLINAAIAVAIMRKKEQLVARSIYNLTEEKRDRIIAWQYGNIFREYEIVKIPEP